MSKKLLITLLLACASVTLIADQEEAHPTSNFEPFTGKIIGSKVRMRTQPSLEGHVVCETRTGQLFAVNGEDSDFYAIQPKKGMKGYIFRTLVLDGVVEGDHVNVRLYPDIEAPVVAQLNTGDHIQTTVSDINNKWLEVDLPDSAHFYVAKEYVDNIGPVELIAKMEKRHREATHHLSSAFMFAQAQIQRPFEQIDLDAINGKFQNLKQDYSDLPDISTRAHEANSVIQEIYVQKKIAFLESKANRSTVNAEIDPTHLDKLAQLGIEIPPAYQEKDVIEIADATSHTLGLASALGDRTDKMLVWEPLEESLFHLWAVAHDERTKEDFYKEEELNATLLSGIVEVYNRPVKNKPGDYLLRAENLPVAFLYSTRINLESLVGKRVTLTASPRPNNNFAFPAYYVLSVE
ncbi:MAG: hypothetical protein S4CHLAM2_07240 [Chlamydiales bacterium]|nr:hypothetical protein [Chlamydiales bacterium]